MDLQNNNVAVKNATATKPANPIANGAAKKDDAAPAKPQAASEPAQPKPETGKPEPANPGTLPVKTELNLEAKLKIVNDLHRKSIQRMNLISRIKQLETFEVALANGGDELNENPYQGCKLILHDDETNEFLTTNPGLIRKVTEFIYRECNLKLNEIEENIKFPAA